MELNQQEIHNVLDEIAREAPNRIEDGHGVAIVQMTCHLAKLYFDEAMGDKAREFMDTLVSRYTTAKPTHEAPPSTQ